MIIGACGFGSTGSSVISDYLLEYENVIVLDGLEFTLVWETDGLIDLAWHVMNPHGSTTDSITAIERYFKLIKKNAHDYYGSGHIDKKVLWESTNNFIDSITAIKWKWYDLQEDDFWARFFKKYLLRNRVIPFAELKLKKRLNCYPMVDVRFSMMPKNFYEAAKRHINELLVAMGADFSKTIVLDQPFSGNNPAVCFPFYEDPYAIVVDRDPRDNYVFARTKLLGRNHFMPVDNVEDYVKYYRGIRDNQQYKEEHERVLRMQFEDLVYDYDNSTKKVREFLHLPANPNPKSIFDPSLSIANTQVYKRFPEYAKDIEYIEKNLSEYLYDFSRHGQIEIQGEMFFGKSPKNKK